MKLKSRSRTFKFFAIILFFIVVIIIVIMYLKPKIENFALGSNKIFRVPPSNTRIKSKEEQKGEKKLLQGSPKTGTIVSYEDLLKISSNFPHEKIDYKGNVLSYPGFFHVNEKWPGCLPRPSYQGTCGSCWGFAAVTALGSRFYIESCGLAGCLNYPQINFGSLNSVYNSINEVYKFRNIYLTNVFKYIDKQKDSKISQDEWISTIAEYCRLFRSIGTPFVEKHYIEQVLNYILDFQSLGSIDLYDCEKVKERAKEVFDVWKDYSDNKDPKNITDPDEYLELVDSTKNAKEENVIDLKALEQKWRSEPINLSAEKIIACCNKCIENDFIRDPDNPDYMIRIKDSGNGVSKKAGFTDDSNKSTVKESELNLVCIGGSLTDAWSTLKNSGTPTASCIGYTMDSYVDGGDTPSCRMIQGPYYSFCSGYSIINKNVNLDEVIDTFEKSKVDPVAIPYNEGNLPWVNPQLFIFKAKNVYSINNDVYAIQREILERGPVTTGFELYPDFQYAFGTEGLGGQKFVKGTNPLGSTSTSLIYKWSGMGESLGGHAIVIVGWGTYNYDPDPDSPTMQPTMQPTMRPTMQPTKGPTKGKGSVKGPIKIPYWICLNSWGYNWGTSGFAKIDDRTKEPYRLQKGGYFWILRGNNECSIEENVVVGQPDLENITYPGVVEKYGWGLPSPSKELVQYIEQRNLDTLPNGMEFIYNKSIEGGSTYLNKIADKKWEVTSMKEPSPYTLFWFDRDRPIFCLGTINDSLDAVSTDDIIMLNPTSIANLQEIIKIQRNPLIVINDEQLQVSQITDEQHGIVNVLRAVNNSIIMYHDKGSEVKVIPFHNLSVPILRGILKECV